MADRSTLHSLDIIAPHVQQPVCTPLHPLLCSSLCQSMFYPIRSIDIDNLKIIKEFPDVLSQFQGFFYNICTYLPIYHFSFFLTLFVLPQIIYDIILSLPNSHLKRGFASSVLYRCISTLRNQKLNHFQVTTPPYC